MFLEIIYSKMIVQILDCSSLILLLMQWQALELRNKELKQSEEKVKAANSELCTKMREMIQELDQEKQEATER